MDCCKLKILSQYEYGFIGISDGHDLFHLHFNNILLNFSLKEFLAFRRITKSIMLDDCLIPFPDGTKKIILYTPYEGTNFSFSTLEIHRLVNLLDEAYYLHEVYGLLNPRGYR